MAVKGEVVGKSPITVVRELEPLEEEEERSSALTVVEDRDMEVARSESEEVDPTTIEVEEL